LPFSSPAEPAPHRNRGVCYNRARQVARRCWKVKDCMPHRIFISHSHKDTAFGLRLHRDLCTVLGSQDAVWFDASGGLQGGAAWWPTIVAEISSRDVFLVLLSPDAMESQWVNDEIDLAWKQKNSPPGKMILPVLIRPCTVREDLQTRQMISFVSPK